MRAPQSFGRLYVIAPFVAMALLLPLAAPAGAATHPSSDPSQLTVVGSRVFFVATTAAHGEEVWVTDGTKGGTHEAADIDTMPTFGSWPHDLTAFGTQLVFFADDGTADGAGRALWKSDGTAAGTKRVGPNGYGLTNVSGKLMFINEDELWRSDGTIAGTRPVATIEGISDPVVALNGFYYFFSNTYTADWVEQIRLWKSDGTAAGTSVVALVGEPVDDEGYVVNSQPDEMTVVGNTVYFLMVEPTAPGRGPADLWQSDGTAAGTHRVYDFDPSATVDYVYSGLAGFGNQLYFGADYTYGADGYATGLWKTNGTESGTKMVKRVTPRALTAVGSRLLFFASDATGDALWRTKGTASTTVKVYRISLPGCEPYSNDPYCRLDETPTVLGSRLFFPAASVGKGIELWVSDGSGAGTRMVKNIGYGAVGSFPAGLASTGNRLFFSAKDTAHGRELWVSNGTARGTHMVLDINPG